MALPLPCAGQAAGVQLAFPLACDIGATCMVQNYVDHDPGPGARDYACGLLTYDGHTGTDIRLADNAALRHGVAALAAAPGRVKALRDGMDDVNVRTIGRGAVAGREAGNSVVFDLGGGWEMQYAHLRKGSIAVKVGDTVSAGQKIGLVGLSGNTSFPHLHFEVRFERKAVDPFVGTGDAAQCAPGARPLWSPDALAMLRYVPTGVIGAGFAGAQARLDDGGVDSAALVPLTADAPAFVFWIQLYGMQENDLEELRIIAPDGRAIAERSARVPANRAIWLLDASLPRRGTQWPAGTYRAEYALYRGEDQTRVVGLVREYTIEAP